MRILKNTIIPLLFTLLIIAGVFFGVSAVRNIIPMGVDRVESYKKTAVGNQMLYIEDTDDLVLYPWNVYDEEKANSVSCNEEFIIDTVKSYSGRDIVITDNCNDCIRTQTGYRDLFLFVDHMKVEDMSGEILYLDMVMMDSAPYVYYFHLAPKSDAAASKEAVEEAEEKVDDFMGENSNSDILSEYLHRLSNPDRIESGYFANIIKNVLIRAQQYPENIAKVSYNDEMMVAFYITDPESIMYAYDEAQETAMQMESGGYTDEDYALFDDAGDSFKREYISGLDLYLNNGLIEEGVPMGHKNDATFILFYNIQNNEISGFSWQ